MIAAVIKTHPNVLPVLILVGRLIVFVKVFGAIKILYPIFVHLSGFTSLVITKDIF